MKNRPHPSPYFTLTKWVRLSSVLVLAFFIAAITLLIPVSRQANRATVPAFADGVVELPLPLGADFAYAANGLTIEKRTTQSSVDQGGLLTYTIEVENVSAGDIYSLLVKDPVPDNTTCTRITNGTHDGVVSWGGQLNFCTQPDGPRAEWTFATRTNPFQTGQSVILKYTVEVHEPFPTDPAEVVNGTNYFVDVLTPTLGMTFGDITVTTPVNTPEWQITKSAAPDPVQPGQPIVYEIAVRNAGELATEGSFTVTDVIPADTTFNPALPGSASPAPTDFDGTTATWVLTNTLDPNQTIDPLIVYTVATAPPLTDGLAIVNRTYSVTGGNVFDQVFGQPVTVTVDSPVTLTVRKQDEPDPVPAGDSLLYTISVTNDNSSKGPALDVEVTDFIPADTKFVTATIGGGVAGAVVTDPMTMAVTWRLTDPIPLGDSIDLIMEVLVDSPLPPGTLLTNVYEAQASNDFTLSPPPADITTTVVSTPVLDLVKTAAPDPVEAGERLTYTLNFSNTGNADATLTITDFLDDRVVYESSIPPGTHDGSPTGGAVVWNWSPPLAGVGPDNPDGDSGTITITVTVTEPFPVNASVTNTAVISAVEGATVSTTITTEVDSQPILTVTKSVVPTPTVEAGQLLTYTLFIANGGNANALEAVLEETVPLSATFLTATVTGLNPPVTSAAGTPFSWTVGTVDIFNTLVYTFVARVDSPLPQGTQIRNSATISSRLIITDSNAVTSTVVSTPNLEIFKTGQPEPVEAGGRLTYTIRYTNSGNTDAVNAVVSDTIPAGTEYESDESAPDVSPGTLSPNEDWVQWTIPTVPGDNGGGVITLTVNVDAPQDNGTVLTNVVAVETTDPKPAGAVTTTTNTITSAPELTLNKSGPAFIKAGQQLVYTIDYTNTGNMDATGVSIIDTYEGLGFYESISASSPGLVLTSPPPAQVVWNIGDVPADAARRTVTFTVALSRSIPDGLVLTNTATMISNQVPNQTDVVTTTVGALQADLAIAKQRLGSGTVVIGNPITYTLTITNEGPDTVDAVITDTFTNAQDNVTTSDPATCPTTGFGQVVCNLTDFTGTKTIQVFIDTSESVSGTVTNAAEIRATDPTVVDDPLTNNTAGPVDVPVRDLKADLSIEKARLGSGEVVVGDLVTFVLTMTNNGPDTVDAVITDTFSNAPDVNVTVSGPPSCQTPSFGQVICTLSNFTGTETIQVSIDTSASISGTITNTAQIKATDSATDTTIIDDPTTNNTSGPVVVPVRDPKADLSIEKARLGSGEVVVGDIVTFVLTMTNNGPDTVDAVITDTFSNAADNVTTSDSVACPATGFGQVVCTLTNFTRTETIQVFIDTTDSVSGTITNTARIKARDSSVVDDPTTNNTSATIDVPVRYPRADLSIAKTRVGTGTVVIDDPITFTLTVTNNGPDTIPSVVITDDFTGASFDQVVSIDPPYTPDDCSSTAAQLICTLEEFTTSIDIVVTLDSSTSISGTTVRNSAAITPASVPTAIETDPADNDSQEITVDVREPATDLQIDKRTALTEVTDGSLIDYTIVVTNAGSDVVDVVITDIFDSNFVDSVVSCDGCDGTGPLSWTLTDFTGVRTLNLVLKTKSGISGTLTNEVEVDFEQFGEEQNPADNRDSEDVIIRQTRKFVYLPLILKSPSVSPTPTPTKPGPQTPTTMTPEPGTPTPGTPTPRADLVITDFFINPANPTVSDTIFVTIIVENQGLVSTGEGFWVDFYVNPSRLPSTLNSANRGWYNPAIGSSQGIAWAVISPLDPGQRVVLTSGGFSSASLMPSVEHTVWDPQLPGGTYRFYAYADSFDSNDPTGSTYVEVVESNEDNNLSELITISVTGGADTVESVASNEEPPVLEPRPDLGR